MSTSRRYPFSLEFTSLLISSGLTSTQQNPQAGKGWDIAQLYKLLASRYIVDT